MPDILLTREEANKMKLEYGVTKFISTVQYGNLLIKHDNKYLDECAELEERIAFRSEVERQARRYFKDSNLSIFLIYDDRM